MDSIFAMPSILRVASTIEFPPLEPRSDALDEYRSFCRRYNVQNRSACVNDCISAARSSHPTPLRTQLQENRPNRPSSLKNRKLRWQRIELPFNFRPADPDVCEFAVPETTVNSAADTITVPPEDVLAEKEGLGLLKANIDSASLKLSQQLRARVWELQRPWETQDVYTGYHKRPRFETLKSVERLTNLALITYLEEWISKDAQFSRLPAPKPASIVLSDSAIRAERLDKLADIALDEMDKRYQSSVFNRSRILNDPKTRRLPIRQPRGPPALPRLIRKPDVNFASRV